MGVDEDWEMEALDLAEERKEVRRVVVQREDGRGGAGDEGGRERDSGRRHWVTLPTPSRFLCK